MLIFCDIRLQIAWAVELSNGSVRRMHSPRENLQLIRSSGVAISPFLGNEQIAIGLRMDCRAVVWDTSSTVCWYP